MKDPDASLVSFTVRIDAKLLDKIDRRSAELAKKWCMRKVPRSYFFSWLSARYLAERHGAETRT